MKAATTTSRFRMVAHVKDLRERLGNSPWALLIARMCAVVVAIGVLSWVGRSRAADPRPLPDESRIDAGAPRVEQEVPPPPPAPASATSPLTAAVGRARASPDDPLYINEATEEDFRRLPGVGAKRAHAIFEARKRVGRFKRIEELLRIKGIGRSAIRKWRPLVRFEARTAPNAADGGPDSAVL